MGLYLDSANVEDVKKAQQLGFIEGITTNPELMAQTNRPALDVLSDLADIFDGHIFYQLTADNVEARTDEAWRAYEIRPDKVVIKVPTTTDNLAMVSRLVPAGIECAMTAVYAPTQAYLATQVRASFVIPYVNRMIRATDEPSTFKAIQDMVHIVANSPTTTVLAASFQSIPEVVATLRAGVEHLALPLDLIMALGEHELSRRDIADFTSHTM